MAAKDRTLQWLYSNKNLAGCALALGGPVLAVTGVVAAPLALALVPVLYAAGALAAPGSRQVNLVSDLDPGDVERSLKMIRKATKGKVSDPVSNRVDGICSSIEQVLPRAHQLGPGSEEMHVLVRTATDYLPSAIEPYLALPRLYAERKPIAEGKTAEVILCEQLDVMAARMDDVVDAVLRADGDKLLANGRFLQDKFGQTDLVLPGPDPRSPRAGELRPPDNPAEGR